MLFLSLPSQGMTNLALKIQQTILGLELNFKLDSITPGNGNCFSEAVVQQCQREVFMEDLKRENRYTKDYMIFKKKVADFAKSSKLPLLVEFKKSFEDVGGIGDENESWDKYWERMLIDKEWVSSCFVQVTAWYLNRDIWMLAEDAIDKQPWMTISGNWQSPNVPCPGVPLILGYNNGLHYQSLLPVEESWNQPQAPEWCSLDEFMRAEKVKVTEKESEVKQDRPVTPTNKRKSDGEVVTIVMEGMEMEGIESTQDLETELNKLKNIKPAKRTEYEKKRLKTLQEKASRKKMPKDKLRESKRKSQIEMRANMPQENIDKEREVNRNRMAAMRANMPQENIDKEREVDRNKKAEMRANMPQEKINKRREVDRNRKAEMRANKSKMSNFEGRCAHNLQDVPDIKELKDTKESIGSMEHRCNYCEALKFKAETPRTCCMGGKVKLDPFPTPPKELQDLWIEQTKEAKVFRNYSRSVANALSLSSIKVNERKFRDAFIPNIIIEGKLMQISGPLQAKEGEQPVFSQLFTHDPQLELSKRIENMSLPVNTSQQEINIITSQMKRLQDLLKQHNPYVKDFIHICEIPDEELAHVKLVISAEARPEGEHERRYNKQSSLTEVSILTNSHPHDLVLRKRGGGLTFVSDLNPSAQPLHFTILFPFGTKGWNKDSRHAGGSTKRITCREFYCYHIQVRNKEKDYLFKAGRLYQEFLCYAQNTNENQRLNFLRLNQQALRADKFKNIEAVVKAEQEKDKIYPDDHSHKIGRKVLPSSFIGGPRWYHAKFQDGMAIVREYRKPDFFITMTCNPHWSEIQDALGTGEKAEDRPDLVARVFNLKKDQLLEDITKKKIFGPTAAYCWVIEWQKRGLPHMHLLVILNNNHR